MLSDAIKIGEKGEENFKERLFKIETEMKV
jgi:hypothetical protein